MTKIAVFLALLAIPAIAGDLELYRRKYVKHGQPDPSRELATALKADATARKADIVRARLLDAVARIKPKKDPAGTARTERLLKKLRQVAGPRFATVGVSILRLDDENAFTAGGDRIYMTDTFLKKLTDGEISVVLAHELSHIVARHAHRRSQLRRRLKVTAAEKALALSLYSRVCEAEADAMATVFLNRAGLPVVTTHYKTRTKLNPTRVAVQLARVRAEVQRLEQYETVLNKMLAKSSSTVTYDRLVALKKQLAAAHAKRQSLERARAFLHLTSEHNHPDIAGRARAVRAAAAGDRRDPLTRYVLEAMGVTSSNSSNTSPSVRLQRDADLPDWLRRAGYKPQANGVWQRVHVVRANVRWYVDVTLSSDTRTVWVTAPLLGVDRFGRLCRSRLVELLAKNWDLARTRFVVRKGGLELMKSVDNRALRHDDLKDAIEQVVTNMIKTRPLWNTK